jgi:hypothetical protein
MQFSEFEEQIFSIDQAIHRELSSNPLTKATAVAKDSKELRMIVRRASEDLILCTKVAKGIRRLQRYPDEGLGLMELTTAAQLQRAER